jgi:hypothetical protein
LKLPRLLPDAGPILRYIECLPVRERTAALHMTAQMLRTPEGVMFLNLLENATLNRSVPITAEPRALDALNAQSLIAHDLRRIVNDEDYIAVGPKATVEHRRTRGRQPG